MASRRQQVRDNSNCLEMITVGQRVHNRLKIGEW